MTELHFELKHTHFVRSLCDTQRKAETFEHHTKNCSGCYMNFWGFHTWIN